MENRLAKTLQQNKKFLSVFYTAGFPRLGDTVNIAIDLENAGVDIIEIGVPFSDPIADGPVIQESNNVALSNGMNVSLLLQQVKEIRKSVKLPIVLMGYLNPIMQFGMERFCKEASEAGVDGVILPDMPMIEFERTYAPIFAQYNLLNTFLISPTTSEARIRKIDAATKGFINAFSSSSTTGANGAFAADQQDYFKKLQGLKLKNPFLIGFGISNQNTFAVACKHAHGAIVGSAFISHLSQYQAENIQSFIDNIKLS